MALDVRFGTADLERRYRNPKAARTAWGDKIARRYVQRVETLYAAKFARDLFALRSLDLHPLKGDRRGQHALRLDGAWRMVVRFDDGMTIVTVEEVSKHYGD